MDFDAIGPTVASNGYSAGQSQRPHQHQNGWTRTLLESDIAGAITFPNDVALSFAMPMCRV
jgi:hypothetical protein